ncbi:GDP-D-glucose phosphorylase 1 [Lepisosteus oculatus]|uniref:GDP-D-glucose phosphorylase 1 n=1 Tax=Lepisosteus oculatus TaxID=7918 RepID=UPI00370F8CAE
MASPCSWFTGVQELGAGFGSGARTQTETFSLMEMTHIHQFLYSDKHFVHNVCWPGDSNKCKHSQFLSKFDLTLRSAWTEKMVQGLFRYHLGDLQTRILPGPHRFVAQLNISRGKERRKPQEILSISQRFDAKQFHFNKIQPGEIVFELCKRDACDASEGDETREGETCSYQNGTADDLARSLVVINVSPLEVGHCLLIPDPSRCLPQILTPGAVRIGIEAVLLSSHPGFRVGFNSLGAFASVNHLHLHGYYLDHELRIESARTEPLIPQRGFHLLPEFPAGFMFYTDGEGLRATVEYVCKLTDSLVERNIAHNLFLTRGRPPGDHPHPDSARPGVRIVVWPRISCFGAKEESAFNVALCELAGHLPFKNQEDFETIEEDDVKRIIEKYLFPENKFIALQAELKHLLNDQPH